MQVSISILVFAVHPNNHASLTYTIEKVQAESLLLLKPRKFKLNVF